MQRLVTHQLKIGEKVFARGVRSFSEEDMKNPHFDFYVKAGHIVVPPSQETKQNFQTPEAIAKLREMEIKHGIPRKGQAAPSSGDVKIEAMGDSGYEPKVADDESVEEAAPVSKKSRR